MTFIVKFVLLWKQLRINLEIEEDSFPFRLLSALWTPLCWDSKERNELLYVFVHLSSKEKVIKSK